MTTDKKERCNKAIQALEEMQGKFPVYKLCSEGFDELCHAIHFYLRGGFSVTETVKLVGEEYFDANGQLNQ